MTGVESSSALQELIETQKECLIILRTELKDRKLENEALTNKVLELQNKLSHVDKSENNQAKNFLKLSRLFEKKIEEFQVNTATNDQVLEELQKMKSFQEQLTSQLAALQEKNKFLEQENVKLKRELKMKLEPNTRKKRRFQKFDEDLESDEEDIVGLDEDIKDEVIKLDVGGEIFLTSLATLRRAGGHLRARFGGDWKQFRQTDGSFFIDRDPKLFSNVLKFLRTGELENEKMHIAEVKRLKLEAEFFNLNDLADRCVDCLAPEPDLSWIDDNCELRGIRDIPGSQISFITAKRISWNASVKFDTPAGYRWASMAELMTNYEKSKHNIQRCSNDQPVYPAWGVEGLGWSRYTKDGMKRLFFVFSDTISTLTFIPSGKNLVSTSKVWKTFDETQEYCEQRGLNFRHCQIKGNAILRGFGGIVCIRDQHETS